MPGWLTDHFSFLAFGHSGARPRVPKVKKGFNVADKYLTDSKRWGESLKIDPLRRVVLVRPQHTRQLIYVMIYIQFLPAEVWLTRQDSKCIKFPGAIHHLRASDVHLRAVLVYNTRHRSVPLNCRFFIWSCRIFPVLTMCDTVYLSGGASVRLWRLSSTLFTGFYAILMWHWKVEFTHTSANVDRFSKFFHQQILKETLYRTVAGPSTSP